MGISLKDQVAQMARYHVWATDRLLNAVAAIPDELYAKQCGLFFGSIHGTLNHLLLTDSEIWFSRFSGAEITSLPLDGELERDRSLLASRLKAAAAQWSGYIASLDEAQFGADLHYTMTTGQPRSLSRASALFHVFNHGTHHRGQVTAAITMLGFEFPPLDLPLLIFSEVA